MSEFSLFAYRNVCRDWFEELMFKNDKIRLCDEVWNNLLSGRYKTSELGIRSEHTG